MAFSGRLVRSAFGVSRTFSTSASKNNKVAVLGAAGGIGQPLSLLLKANAPAGLKNLALYDIVHTPGVGADLSHINTEVKVSAHVGNEQLGDALQGAKVVVIPAGVPRKPGMTRDDLFNTNAGIVRDLAAAAAKHCPEALLCIITNPVNSMVPIASEVYKKAGVYDQGRIFGVTTLDLVRAQTFVAEAKGLEPQDVTVPVVGGHAGETILPLLSQVSPGCVSFSKDEILKLTERIQNAGTEVVNAKAGAGSATLSMAYAGAVFASSALNAVMGLAQPVVYSYIRHEGAPAKYFALPIRLGRNGVDTVFPMGELSTYEQECVEKNVAPQLKASIEKGEKFVGA